MNKITASNIWVFSWCGNKSDNDVHMTIVDIPEQIALAKKNIQQENLEGRIDLLALDVLDHSQPLPNGYDIIWMSQFLDCFKEEDIVDLLKRTKKAMKPSARLYIMEPLWDKQRFETSAYCIINTSPYFTAMANGYSKMFHSKEMINVINKSGLEVVEEISNIGICQNIIICK